MASASDRDSGVMHTCSGSSLNGRSIAGAAHLEANCFTCTEPTEESAEREAETASLLTMMYLLGVSDAEYSRCKRRHELGGRGERGRLKLHVEGGRRTTQTARFAPPSVEYNPST